MTLRNPIFFCGLGLLLLSSCRKDLAPNTPVFEFCPGSPTVTDVDGQVYNTVLIGGRCWTRNNLRVTKFRNGDGLGSDPSLNYWTSVNQGSFSLYDNQSVNKGDFGYLYNGYAVTDARGLCPTGWHVPTDQEWGQMIKSLDPSANSLASGAESSTAGGPLKSTDLWNSPNSGATNASGFSAVPGGFRSESGVFGAKLDGGTYWSSTPDGSSRVWFRYLYDDNASVVRNSGSLRQGRSVRCIRDLTGTGGGGGGSDTLQSPTVITQVVSGITSNTANSGGQVVSDGGSTVVQRGVAYGLAPLPDLNQSYTMNGTGTGSFASALLNLSPNTLYHVRAYATNAVGTSYGNQEVFTSDALPPPPGCQANACPGTPTVTDFGGRVYGTVKIGNQCWMASNLRTVHYQNGDPISPWGSNQNPVGYHAVYNNQPSNEALYGLLYNTFAVIDSRGLCPTGWRVPSSADFDVLATFLDPNSVSGSAVFNGAVSTMAGGEMKSLSLWNSPNVGATNGSCFDAVGAGYRGTDANYYNQGLGAYFWTTTTGFPGGWNSLLDRRLWSFSSELVVAPNAPELGFSVRCIKNNSGN